MKLRDVPDPVWYGAMALAAVVVVGLIVSRKGVKGVASGAVGAVNDTAAGLVEGIGGIFGVPTTDEAECERAKREGAWFTASLYCDAPTFVGSGALAAGNAVQDAIVPGEGTLGTWVFDRVQDVRHLFGLPSDHDASGPTPSRPNR